MTMRLIAQLRTLHTNPRFHGNGFIQLPLSANKRLHVWDRHLPPIEDHNATIHDHTWKMRSQVLAGRLEHRTYDARVHGTFAIETPWTIFELEGTQSGRSKPKADGYPCSLTLTGTYEMSSGSSYFFDRNKLHESYSVADRTVTIIEKFPEPDDFKFPRVVAPRGQRPVDAFDEHHTHQLSTMWAVIEEAIAEMHSPAHQLIEACIQ
jgi:hypothetical protein